MEERTWAMLSLCASLLERWSDWPHLGQVSTPWPREEGSLVHSFLIDQTRGNARWVVPQNKIWVLKERGINAGQAKQPVPIEGLAHEPGNLFLIPKKNHSISLLSVSCFFPRSNFSADSSPKVKVGMRLTLQLFQGQVFSSPCWFLFYFPLHSLFLLTLTSEPPPTPPHPPQNDSNLSYSLLCFTFWAVAASSLFYLLGQFCLFSLFWEIYQISDLLQASFMWYIPFFLLHWHVNNFRKRGGKVLFSLPSCIRSFSG